MQNHSHQTLCMFQRCARSLHLLERAHHRAACLPTASMQRDTHDVLGHEWLGPLCRKDSGAFQRLSLTMSADTRAHRRAACPPPVSRQHSIHLGYLLTRAHRRASYPPPTSPQHSSHLRFVQTRANRRASYPPPTLLQHSIHLRCLLIPQSCLSSSCFTATFNTPLVSADTSTPQSFLSSYDFNAT